MTTPQPQTAAPTEAEYQRSANSTRPEALETNPVTIIARELIDELWRPARYPPGPTMPSLGRTLAASRYPLPMLLSLYGRYGPIFTFRALHRREVFMIGPAANQFITVEHPELFHWREGHFGELAPLIGDGLITTDGRYHDRARRLLMPAFHREHLQAAIDAMVDEARRAICSWPTGETIDVYERLRELALRISMRALLGLDPDDSDRGAMAAGHFERALSFYGTDAPQRVLRGPGTPWSRMRAACRALDEIVYLEIERRRQRPSGERRDILSLLLDAEDEDESRFSDEEIRDHVVSLMFAGHDTSSSTTAFLLYEIACHPDVLDKLHDEQDRVLAGATPTAAQLHSDLPALDMALDETLRLYPPVWIGARRAMTVFQFAGCHVPAGAYVNYSSWASHRLPDVFPDPEAFIPERFTRERKAALPKGAYIPFGAGSRICIGKRFGQTMVKTIATLLLQNVRFELPPDHKLRLAIQPTLSPRGGMPMIVRERTAHGNSAKRGHTRHSAPARGSGRLGA